jgi:Hemerythrin HHE cation binding domain
MPHPYTAQYSAVAARNEVLGLLRGDHDRVLEEFREFDRLESLAADQACQRVVQRTFAELKVLANVEQQLFYPAVHDAIAGTDLIDQSEIEHARILRLIDELEAAEPMQPRYRHSFRTLGEYVRRHVYDEEHELYPVLSTAQVDWQSLYEQMTSRRAELAEDLGVPDLDAEHDDDSDAMAEFETVEEEPELAMEGQH